ncbi:tetratricopeptide repeat protein [Geomesophilobacter sediminis]|uniref:Tetratricopeptide repeat protein n=1 Tax=Geomesophilobacter sediminis TaxID=2798584 RepID=A0A8J7M0D6_9BACT|nr:tetratricopeptide repeat protein [Geomesophilobacter sediminis]MBJ6724632.1 tetratricopeptide repeat protein [Geomesophilobacter sediminis]
MEFTPTSVPELLESARQQASSGRPADALMTARAVLQREPENLAALDLAARAAWSLGDLRAAESYWQTALRAHPFCAEAYNNLGALYAGNGQREAAKASFLHALGIAPDYADAHANLGALYIELGQLTDAVACYRRVTELRPEEATAHYRLGILLKELGGVVEAEACYRRAIELRPEWDEPYNNLGVLLVQQKRYPEAEECFRLAITRNPDGVDGRSNLGVLLAKSGRFAAAAVFLEEAAALGADQPEVHYNLGNVLAEMNRFGAAEACYRRALLIRPDHADAHYNLGNLLARLMRFNEAQASFRCALAARPGFPEALNNLGNLLALHQFHGEAEEYYRRALALEPGLADARWNLGLLLLALGEFEEGWELYEARYHPEIRQNPWRLPELPFPQWGGEDLRGKSIVIWPEQGFGDEIQFVRYLPLLRERGVARLTLVCKDELKQLFLDSAVGADRIVALSETEQLEAHEYWCYSLSVPRHLGTRVETIPAAVPYLTATPLRMRGWGERLPAAGFRVGLVWKGAPGHRNDASRSLPGLASLAPLWSVPGLAFIGLQKDAGEPAASFPEQPLLDLGPELRDFADTAAVIAQLDLVICVDTAVAHLAGALGKPCWVLLPYHATDWRWMIGREDSPWYPGVLRLFRQEKLGEWDEVVARVRKALSEVAGLG